MKILRSRKLDKTGKSFRIIMVITIAVLLLPLLLNSCTLVDSETRYLEKADDYAKTLSLIMQGIRIDDYRSTTYDKHSLIEKIVELDPSLHRLAFDVEHANPPSELLNYHQQLQSLVDDAIRYISRFHEVVVKDNAPVFYYTPERRTNVLGLDLTELDALIDEYYVLARQIKDIKETFIAEIEKIKL